MMDDPNSFRSRATSFFQQKQKQIVERVQHGQQRFAAARSSFLEQHPEVSRHVDSLQQSIRDARSSVSRHVDEGVANVGVTATNLGRERVKFKENPADWFPQRYQKRAFNFGVDVLADNLETISRSAKDFGSGVQDKIASTTMDRMHPRHLATLVQQPQDLQRYMAQRLDQLRQPLDFYRDPSGFASKKWQQGKNSFYNAADRVSEMDSGVGNKIRHGGRIFVDMAQEKIAPAIGVGVGIAAIYNARAQQRKGTRDKMNSMFPKKRLYGKAFRTFPVRMMFSKPLARIAGNPRLSALMLGYSVLTGIGKNIEDSRTLKRTSPQSYNRLKENGTEMYKSGTQVSIRESTARTSQAQPQKAKR